MKKKILIIIAIIIFTFVAGFLTFKMTNYTRMRGDSGFDSSYDSGSSSSSSSSSYSSSSSSSSWDSSSSSSSSGDSSSSLEELSPIEWVFIGLFLVVFFGGPLAFILHNSLGKKGIIIGLSSSLIIIVLIILMKYFPVAGIIMFIACFIGFFVFISVMSKIEGKKNNYIIPQVSDEELMKYGFEKQALTEQLYKIYVDVQEAWMNFDYVSLRNLLTDELYNQYEMQLKTLEDKKEKNIMSDYVLDNCIITSLQNTNNLLILKCKMDIELYDYIVDKDNKCIRGLQDAKIMNYYEMVFVKSLNNDQKCPNCGAKLNSESRKCEHCGSIITTVSNKWVLSKKEIV